MLLRCVNAFGNFGLGDEVEVSDGALFDSAYFRAWSVLGESVDRKDAPGKDEKTPAKEGNE